MTSIACIPNSGVSLKTFHYCTKLLILRPVILHRKSALSWKVNTIFISFHGLFFSGTVHPTEHWPQLSRTSTQMVPPGQWRGGTSVDGFPFWPVTIHNRNLVNYASPDVFQAFLAPATFYFPRNWCSVQQTLGKATRGSVSDFVDL